MNPYEYVFMLYVILPLPDFQPVRAYIWLNTTSSCKTSLELLCKINKSKIESYVYPHNEIHAVHVMATSLKAVSMSDVYVCMLHSHMQNLKDPYSSDIFLFLFSAFCIYYFQHSTP
jgi:hypothetical protein